MEADFGSEPGDIGVRGIHVVPGYCHPLPLTATKGEVLFSLGHVLADPNIFQTTTFFYTYWPSVHTKPLNSLMKTIL